MLLRRVQSKSKVSARCYSGVAFMASLLVIVCLFWFHPTSAFSASHITTRTTESKTSLLAAFFDDDDWKQQHFPANNNHHQMVQARTCIRNLLTQRAVQSFLFLLISCRDPHTASWLQDNLQTKNLEHFHGTGAFNLTLFPTWDSVLLELLSKPKESIVIRTRSRRGGGGSGWRGQIAGGWSGGGVGQQQQQQGEKRTTNPYLEEKVIETEIEIDPVSLVSRIVSVREQIAAEFKTDFDTLIRANDQILSSYFQTTQENSCVGDDDDDYYYSNDDDGMTTTNSSLTIPYSDATTSSSSSSRRRQSSDKNNNKNPSRRRNAFDRFNAMVLLSNTMDYAQSSSSPLRKANFDLMLLLSTQESIHRVLKQYAQGGGEERRDVSLAWLRDFYLERVQQYFDGHHQQYGRADDILEDLLLTPPMFKTLHDDDNNNKGSSHRKKEMVGLVDPLRMAEDIIRMRSRVGKEWKDIMANVPVEHTELRRLILARQMMAKDIVLEICDDGFE